MTLRILPLLLLSTPAMAQQIFVSTTHDSAIWVLNADGSSTDPQLMYRVGESEGATNIEVDSTGRLYFGDGNQGQYFSAAPDGTDRQMIIASNPNEAHDLAIDEVNGHLYFTGDEAGVWRSDMNGQGLVRMTPGPEEAVSVEYDTGLNTFWYSDNDGLIRRSRLNQGIDDVIYFANSPR